MAVVMTSSMAWPDGSAPAAAARTPVILFVGDSFTEGYGVTPSESYPALIQARIQKKGWPFQVENQSRSSDTSGDALDRISDRLKEPFDVLVVAVGANDGFQHVSPKVLDRNLRAIVRKAYAANKGAHILIVGMRMPLEQGEYARRFNDIYQRVAWEYRTAYLPFLLEDVIEVPELTLSDHLHPNADGYRIVADHVWGVLEPMLKRYYPQLTETKRSEP